MTAQMRLHAVQTGSRLNSTVWEWTMKAQPCAPCPVFLLLMKLLNNTGGARRIIHDINISSHLARFVLSTSSMQDADANMHRHTGNMHSREPCQTHTCNLKTVTNRLYYNSVSVSMCVDQKGLYPWVFLLSLLDIWYESLNSFLSPGVIKMYLFSIFIYHY